MRWTRAGRTAAIRFVLDGDGKTELRGSGPTVNGAKLDPYNEFDHDVLWWLDRIVRTTRPFEERMTLFWHDHFATAAFDPPAMIAQNETLRRHALGRFDSLLRAVFIDPAMQDHLSIAGSHKKEPNENFARELFELYTLGAGNNYTEDDIREASRAFTGWVAEYRNGRIVNLYFDAERHDNGPKTIFGQTGTWDWEEALRLTLARKGMAEFVVSKLYTEFVGKPPDRTTRRDLVRRFQRSGHSIRTVMNRILALPAFYADLDRPDTIKSPVVFLGTLLRTNGWAADRRSWAQLLTMMGQRPFVPPSVAGWDGGAAWCSSTAFRARWLVAHEVVRPKGVAPVGDVDPGLDPSGQLALAKRALGNPWTSPSADRKLRALATTLLARPAADDAARKRNAETAQRALRYLLIAGPDNQLH